VVARPKYFNHMQKALGVYQDLLRVGGFPDPQVASLVLEIIRIAYMEGEQAGIQQLNQKLGPAIDSLSRTIEEHISQVNR
jgi:hypothetical protein